MKALPTSVKAVAIPYTAPVDAPKAKTRALAACNDLSNSCKSALILPQGALLTFISTLAERLKFRNCFCALL